MKLNSNMDTTEKYIEMCKAKEIQSRWRPTDGDFYVYSVVIKDPQIMIMSSKFGIEPMDLSQWVWLPRQDQLQDMLSASVTIGYMICGLEAFYDPERVCGYVDPCRKCRNLGERRRTTYDTMCQWWLAFVMHEKFGKWWSIEKSEWIECGDGNDEL
jgi:hypothetical protein